jgi:hypothetical protein
MPLILFLTIDVQKSVNQLTVGAIHVTVGAIHVTVGAIHVTVGAIHELPLLG